MTAMKALLFCISFACIFALPVQSQPTAIPTPAALVNPAGGSCGLPAAYATFNSSATVNTFNLTANCTLSNSAVPTGDVFLTFTSGTFTINGNGYSIIGPSNAQIIRVQGLGTTLNLNNVTIRQAGQTSGQALDAQSGGQLNANGVTFRDNVNRTVVNVDNSQADFMNVQFLNNRAPTANSAYGSALTATSSTVSITNSIFDGNSGQASVIVVNGGTLTFGGCITFSGNTQAGGGQQQATDSEQQGSPTVTDSTHGICYPGFTTPTPVPTSTSANVNISQRQEKKKAAPESTATPRPMAATCIGLREAAGIVVRATFGLQSGVQCQLLDGGGVGIQSLIDAGFLAAVDIWGYVEQGVEACFPQSGRFIFLDARAIPRTQSPLASYTANGMTCAAIKSPGSIVLLPS